MHFAELTSLTPFIMLILGGLTVLILGVWPQHVPTRILTTITLASLLLGVAATLLWETPQTVSGLLVIDNLGRLFIQFFMLGAIAIIILSIDYIPTQNEVREEYLSLILFATLGMTLLATSDNLVTAFVGLEIIAVPLFAYIAWKPERNGAIEGGIKYALLAGFATAFFLYGISLVYASAGTLSLAALSSITPDNQLVYVAVTLMLVGMGFKLALVPFHMWAPDIYQASPAPITALFASIAKVAVLAFLIRLFCLQLQHIWEALLPLLWILAVISMIAGNLLALHQQNLKRLLAYSSIAHLGYILVALAAGTSLGRDAAIYYALIYALMNLGTFAVIAAFSLPDQDRQDLKEYRGLGRHYPVLGAAMGVCLLALAGLPPTAGFVAKLLAFGAAIEAGYVMLAMIAVINTALAFYYYMRILVVFYGEKQKEQYVTQPSQGTSAIVIVISLLIVGLGMFPEWMLMVIKTF